MINLTGLAGSSNTTGDDQKKLDVIGNDLFVAAMKGSGKCRALVSEEEEDIIYFDESPNARYVVACDPIDGSSNLDAGVSVGTIFGIMKLPDSVVGEKPKPEDLLMPGTELIAAGYDFVLHLTEKIRNTDILCAQIHHVRCLGSTGHHHEGWYGQRLHLGTFPRSMSPKEYIANRVVTIGQLSG